MPESVATLQAALERLVVVLYHCLETYGNELEPSTGPNGAPPCAGPDRAQHYLSRLQQELGATKHMDDITQAIYRAATLIHASRIGEPYWPSLALLAGPNPPPHRSEGRALERR